MVHCPGVPWVGIPHKDAGGHPMPRSFRARLPWEDRGGGRASRTRGGPAPRAQFRYNDTGIDPKFEVHVPRHGTQFANLQAALHPHVVA